MTKTQDKAMTIPLTEEEGRLIEIAVRLACAIQYWEKHFRKMDSESRDQLLKKGIDHELMLVNEIFDQHEILYAAEDFPRVHPIITVVGEEWGRMEEENRHTLNFHAYSSAQWLDRSSVTKLKQTEWPTRLTMTSLPKLLKYQKCHCWWLPGASHEQEDEEDDNMNDPDVSVVAYAHTPEDSGGDGGGGGGMGSGASPMEEDDEDGDTPRKPRAQKRPIVVSPSQKNEHPARRARVGNIDEFCGPCKDSGVSACMRQLPHDSDNKVCVACSLKQQDCSNPPPVWACDPSSALNEKAPESKNKASESGCKVPEKISSTVQAATQTPEDTRDRYLSAFVDDVAPALISLRTLLGQNTEEFRGQLLHIEDRIRLMTLINRERFDSLERQLFTNSGIGTSSPTISVTSPNLPVYDMSRMSLESPLTAGPSEGRIGLTTSRASSSPSSNLEHVQVIINQPLSRIPSPSESCSSSLSNAK